MKPLRYLAILLWICSCQDSPDKGGKGANDLYQKAHWRHLAYLIQLKNEVARNAWKGFSNEDFFQPAVYYTHEGTFVLNPNTHILGLTEHQEVSPFDQTAVIKLSEKYTDTTRFNFSASYSDSDSTALYYRENVLFFQSFDLTQKLIGIDDLQDWSIMVIHELFHGYQRSIPEYKAYYTTLHQPGGPDAFLGKYHRELPWFRQSVREENEILKRIWIEGADVASNLHKYDSLRTTRIEKIKDAYGVDIREVEDYEILSEGHARYFESLCKRHLSESDGDTSMLTEEDLPLISNLFADYDIKKDEALYDLYNDRYYYQLGYNLSMILEKHLPAYRETIYTEAPNFNRYIETLKARNLNQRP